MNLKPLTIDEVLKHDVSYPACTPVVLFDRSPRQKFVAFLSKARFAAGLVLLAALTVASCSGSKQAAADPVLRPAPVKLTLTEPMTSPSLLRGHYLFKSTGMMGTTPFIEVGSEDLDGAGHYTFRSVFNAGGSVCMLAGEGTYELHGLRGFIRGRYRSEAGTCGTGGDEGIIELSSSGSSFYAASTETTATFLVEFRREK